MPPEAVQTNIYAWNARLVRRVKSGQNGKALEIFQHIQQLGLSPDKFTFIPVLNACANLGQLEEGRRIHSQVAHCDLGSDLNVGTSLISMYSKLGRIAYAQEVFDNMPVRSVVSWNALILGYVKCGQGQRALEQFTRLQEEGVEPNHVTFVGLLKACAGEKALEQGRRVHEQVIQKGYEMHVFVASSLVGMYSKCASIDDAWKVFQQMPSRNVVAWTAMIQGCLKCGQWKKAIELCRQMQREKVEPDAVTFVGFLNACARVGALEEGRCVHEQIIQKGYESDVFVASSLIDMYAKCGSIEEAVGVFKAMPAENVVTWNSMIQGFVKGGQGRRALELFEEMQRQGVEPNGVTFVGLINACASATALEEGRRIHEQILEKGFESDVIVGSTLLNMYSKCGKVEEAWRIFERMPARNVISWSTMIQGYVNCGQGQRAVEVYLRMQQERVEPNVVTLVSVLSAYASLGALEEGRRIHDQIVKKGWEANTFAASSLIDMYAKCGSLEDASNVFQNSSSPNVVVWNSMIHGFAKFGEDRRALELCQRLLRGNEVDPDAVTFVGALNACASLGAVEEGRAIHEQIIQRGLESDLMVGNGLIDMYAKCGLVDEASQILRKMSTRSVVSWNALIQGQVKCGEGQKALETYRWMEREGVEPDAVTFVGVLNACASVTALEQGRSFHERIRQLGFDSNLFVGNSLIDMYAKCGSIGDAKGVFNTMPQPNLVSWNAMLGGYAMHGYGIEALGHFERMVLGGREMDKVTFISLMAACSHAGLVDEGLHYFESMKSVYGVPADVEHWACVVDLLGRAGRLHEAKELIQMTAGDIGVAVWMSLLGACRVHGNLEMGESIAERALQADPGNAAGYVLLSNIYATAGKWDRQALTQRRRIQRGVNKIPGRAWIELDNKVHSFRADDQEHPKMNEIRTELERLNKLIMEAGFVSDVTFVLRDVEEDEKVSRLHHHSEKLAIAFGLISTPAGTPLRITKNLRVCGDCHSATKFISKMVGREIVVRDASRFHHFRNGLCSCRDFW